MPHLKWLGHFQDGKWNARVVFLCNEIFLTNFISFLQENFEAELYLNPSLNFLFAWTITILDYYYIYVHYKTNNMGWLQALFLLYFALVYHLEFEHFQGEKSFESKGW